ncbi:GMP synthase [glutamine-hydrolyzing] subunit A [Gossypium arboreum]|uniref:GMP synthase [glutamine-hydrolyzing] subunit A n=1 Tax=Gossypium arboreum TaxID=29729 RepID=A0A0B0N265_GOSAR|nr:GMP synthase [glutamine-hydrolyzing] subunit A [Gossypium arboreum]
MQLDFGIQRNERQKQKFTHTAGSKSVACVADDEELSSGQKVGHLQLFDITYRKKDGSPMTIEAAEIMEKLKDKRTEYELISSSDSFVNLDDIDNRIITEVLGPERYVWAQDEVQMLRDQMAQMQASTVEQIAQLQHREKHRLKEIMKNSSYNLKWRQ